MNRFAYEHAEEQLDRFSLQVRSKAFQRTYRKFKLIIYILAYCDFSYPNLPSKGALSGAWEEVQLAFKGLGDSTLHGCIFEMWSNLSDKDKKFFLSSVRLGFEKAEDATPDDFPRRYLLRYRSLAVRNPGDGYNYKKSDPPISGAKRKEWARGEGHSQEEHKAFLDWLGGRPTQSANLPVNTLRSEKVLFLQLVAKRKNK